MRNNDQRSSIFWLAAGLAIAGLALVVFLEQFFKPGRGKKTGTSGSMKSRGLFRRLKISVGQNLDFQIPPGLEADPVRRPAQIAGDFQIAAAADQAQ